MKRYINIKSNLAQPCQSTKVLSENSFCIYPDLHFLQWPVSGRAKYCIHKAGGTLPVICRLRVNIYTLWEAAIIKVVFGTLSQMGVNIYTLREASGSKVDQIWDSVSNWHQYLHIKGSLQLKVEKIGTLSQM